jgi:copper chaperone CopZ
MKIKHIFLSAIITCFVVVGCKKGENKETLPVQKENVSLAISGMTCEIGCAKTIESKLSKKEGVLNAKVVFKDSIATVEFDANKTSKKDLIAFVDGIAGGELYKASVASEKEAHTCKENCKESCKMKMKAEKSKCCTKDSNGKMVCLKDCKMACCVDKKS